MELNGRVGAALGERVWEEVKGVSEQRWTGEREATLIR